MTLEERDQYAMLQADWSPAYDITHHPGAPRPFQAILRDRTGTVLQAATPHELRVMVRDHHASRTRGELAASEVTP